MSLSGQGPCIFMNFINRKTGADYAIQPATTEFSFGSDMREFTGSFDFQVHFGPYDKVAISSHDYVEFYFMLGDEKFQVGVGFIEDFVKKTDATGNVFQGNGRQLIAQLMLFPFKTRVYKDGLSYLQFLNLSLENTYLRQYLAYRNRSSAILDYGAYTKPMIFTDVATAPRAQVVQEYAELALNLVYQDRLGRLCVYGRSNKDVGKTFLTLDAYGDSNVISMDIKENYSKVFSEVTVIYDGQQMLDGNQIKETSAASSIQVNSDPRASGLNQPIYKIFSAQDLVGLAGNVSDIARIEDVAKSTVRKGNQNLSIPIIVADAPYYQDPTTGFKKAYEIGQIWTLKNEAFDVNQEYKLVGIHYQQNESSLTTQLAFCEKDTLV